VREDRFNRLSVPANYNMDMIGHDGAGEDLIGGSLNGDGDPASDGSSLHARKADRLEPEG